jgi:antitoxin component YwqK of YwqJK toxin-antitoxin module
MAIIDIKYINKRYCEFIEKSQSTSFENSIYYILRLGSKHIFALISVLWLAGCSNNADRNLIQEKPEEIRRINFNLESEFLEERQKLTYYKGTPYTGEIFVNYENGSLKFKGNYVEGQLNGIYEVYSENGQLEAKVIFRDGKENGLSEYYSTLDGKLFSIGNYVDGILVERGSYKNDKRNGLSYWYYVNGQVKAKCNYKDGKRHGLSEFFAADGNLISSENYIDGKLKSN